MADDNKTAAKNAAKAAADIKKQKKKKWCPIVAPELFNNHVIGESLVDDASLLMGKAITANMMQLTGDMKKQNVNLMFKVIDVKEGKGLTQLVKYELSPSSLKRLAKREKDKLSDSFVVKTADGKLVRIKPIMITNNQTKGSTLAALIKNCRAVCKEIVNHSPFDQLIVDLVEYKFQKQVRDALHQTYPLRNLEIRSFAIETKKKKETVEEELLERMKQQQKKKDQEKADASEEETPKQQDENSETDEPIDQAAELEESGDSEESDDNSEEDSEEEE